MAVVNKLKAKELSTLPNGSHGDGNNLFLIVRGNSRAWVFRYQHLGKEIRIGLGSFPEVPLDRARYLAIQNKSKLVNGEELISPSQQKKIDNQLILKQADINKSKSLTFKEISHEFIEIKKHEWKNEKHLGQWRRTVEKYSDNYSDLPINEVNKNMVRENISKYWIEQNETAQRTRGRIEQIFNYAIEKEYYQFPNPAVWKGGLEFVVANPKTFQKVRQMPSLDYRKIHEFWFALKLHSGSAKRAIQLQILTATRQGEVRLSEWNEFDLDNEIPVWNIPAEHQKRNINFRVPLSSQAVTLLKEWKDESDSKWVFPNQRKTNCISDGASSKLIMDMNEKEHIWIDNNGVDIVPHGFRSSFRNWTADCTDYDEALLELCLSHNVGNEVSRAYRRTDQLERRAEVMQNWSDFIYKIIPMKSQKFA